MELYVVRRLAFELSIEKLRDDYNKKKWAEDPFFLFKVSNFFHFDGEKEAFFAVIFV